MKFDRCMQLSVYLENRVGALADICKIIEQKRINLIAICAIDTVDEAVLRIVPEDHLKTRDALTALSMHLIFGIAAVKNCQGKFVVMFS